MMLNNIPDKFFDRILQDAANVFELQSKRHWPGNTQPVGMIDKKNQMKKFQQITNACADLGVVLIWIDVAKNKIKATSGINELLGYKESDFTIKEYFQLVSPVHFTSWAINEYFIREIMLNDEHHLKVMTQRFVSTVNITTADKKQMSFRKSAYAFQKDKAGSITEYLVVLVSPAKETTNPYSVDLIGAIDTAAEYEKLLQELIKRAFRLTNRFSKKQQELIQFLENISVERLKNYQEITGTTGWHKENITTQVRLMRKKVEKHFPPFSTGIDFLKYLRICSFI